jgi:hypothetical protein
VFYVMSASLGILSVAPGAGEGEVLIPPPTGYTGYRASFFE